MSRIRGGALKRKKKTAKLGKDANAKKSSGAPSKKPERRARPRGRDRRDDDEDEDDARGRGGPPPKKDSTPIVVGVVACLLLVVLVAAFAGGGGSSLVDEHEAEKAFNYVENQYKLAKGGDALAENRAALRKAFEKVVEAYPGTEWAKEAEKRIRELQ